MGPDDMVLCSGTLKRGVPFAERLSAASGAGFAAVSMWGRDYAAARAEGLDDADLRAMLDAHGLHGGRTGPGLVVAPGGRRRAIPPGFDTEDVFRFGEDELFAVAEAVGARSLNAVDVLGGTWGIDAGRRGVRRAVRPCGRARSAGPPRVAPVVEGSLISPLPPASWPPAPERRSQHRRLAPGPVAGAPSRSWLPCPATASSASSSTTARWRPKRT